MLSIQVKKRTVIRFKMFGESSHLLNFAFCVSPREKCLICKKNQTTQNSKELLLYMLANEYKETFYQVLSHFGPDPLFLLIALWVKSSRKRVLDNLNRRLTM